MGCISNYNNQNEPADLQTIQAANQLAHLLESTLEYRLFLHLTEKIYSDTQAGPLMHQLSTMQSGYFQSFNEKAIADIQEKLESMPLMQEYEAAEQQVFALFRGVDQIVSQEAGLPFAENAISSGFG